jgi:hypothetical protein
MLLLRGRRVLRLLLLLLLLLMVLVVVLMRVLVQVVGVLALLLGPLLLPLLPQLLLLLMLLLRALAEAALLLLLFVPSVLLSLLREPVHSGSGSGLCVRIRRLVLVAGLILTSLQQPALESLVLAMLLLLLPFPLFFPLHLCLPLIFPSLLARLSDFGLLLLLLLELLLVHSVVWCCCESMSWAVGPPGKPISSRTVVSWLTIVITFRLIMGGVWPTVLRARFLFESVRLTKSSVGRAGLLSAQLSLPLPPTGLITTTLPTIVNPFAELDVFCLFSGR